MTRRKRQKPDVPVSDEPVDLELLSRKFARLLFERHPEWRRFAGRYDLGREESRIPALEVRIPSEHPSVSAPLLVQVRRGEVYLEWDGWHDHVFGWPEERLEEVVAAAVTAVENWTSDRYLFARVYEGERLTREWGCFAGEEHPDDLTPRAGERTCIRSWRGTHDWEF